MIAPLLAILAMVVLVAAPARLERAGSALALLALAGFGAWLLGTGPTVTSMSWLAFSLGASISLSVLYLHAPRALRFFAMAPGLSVAISALVAVPGAADVSWTTPMVALGTIAPAACAGAALTFVPWADDTGSSGVWAGLVSAVAVIGGATVARGVLGWWMPVGVADADGVPVQVYTTIVDGPVQASVAVDAFAPLPMGPAVAVTVAALALLSVIFAASAPRKVTMQVRWAVASAATLAALYALAAGLGIVGPTFPDGLDGMLDAFTASGASSEATTSFYPTDAGFRFLPIAAVALAMSWAVTAAAAAPVTRPDGQTEAVSHFARWTAASGLAAAAAVILGWQSVMAADSAEHVGARALAGLAALALGAAFVHQARVGRWVRVVVPVALIFWLTQGVS